MQQKMMKNIKMKIQMRRNDVYLVQAESAALGDADRRSKILRGGVNGADHERGDAAQRQRQ